MKKLIKLVLVLLISSFVNACGDSKASTPHAIIINVIAKTNIDGEEITGLLITGYNPGLVRNFRFSRNRSRHYYSIDLNKTYQVWLEYGESDANSVYGLIWDAQEVK